MPPGSESTMAKIRSERGGVDSRFAYRFTATQQPSPIGTMMLWRRFSVAM